VRIERVEVEGGFLDGLDLALDSGLNVLIGPRGTGKTSIIELIRFCLNAPGLTKRYESRSRSHALGVLGSGEVTVTLSSNGQTTIVRRSATDGAPRHDSHEPLELPTVLSQGEIEHVGVDPVGRLNLLDDLRSDVYLDEIQVTNVTSRITSLTIELEALSREIASLNMQIAELEGTGQELAAAQKEEQATQDALGALHEQRTRLDQLNQLQAGLSVRREVIERSLLAVANWRTQLEQTASFAPVIEEWPESAAGEDASATARKRVAQVREALGGAATRLLEAENDLRSDQEEATKALGRVQDEARELRRELDAVAKGAGELSRRVALLREQSARLSSLKALLEQRDSQLKRLHAERHQLLDELDEARNRRFAERKQIAGSLDQRFSPRIRVDVRQYGLVSAYSAEIANALTGSGLKYNLLAPVLAANLSPRELVEGVEGDDADSIATGADIDLGRAHRVVEAIRRNGSSTILVAPLEDKVELRLFDGQDYKATDSLSLGQRCTIVLPLLLSSRTRGLIIDQPEDNLDNAFIVDTLIQGILERSRESQLLFATHNANIPVLGEASRVVILNSDGKRGFVETAGHLDDTAVVKAITSVMEGGLDAFRRRADFYRQRLENG
jgi:hypothetical protein